MVISNLILSSILYSHTPHFIDNNQLKRDLYNDLNSYWTRAIQMAASRHQEGEVYSAQTVNELAKQ